MTFSPTGSAPGHSLDRDIHAVLMPGFAGSRVPGWVRDAADAGLLTLCLYGTNAAGPGGLAAVAAALRASLPEVLLAVDEEGGDVTRVHYPEGSPTPGNALLGRIDDPLLTRDAARAIGGELAAYGIGLDLAPVVDINSDPRNPVIGARSFGTDPDRVARHAAAAVAGLRSAGVAACAKHFPGHGDVAVDSHLGLPRLTVAEEVLRRRELVPFMAAVDAGAACVMTSHIVVEAVDPDRPATFSPAVLALLREGLGFDGVIVTDALDMAGASGSTGVPEAGVRALLAGCDLLCLGPEPGEAGYAAAHEAIAGAVASGRLPAERVHEAAQRVRGLASSVPGTAPETAPATDGPAPVVGDAALARGFLVTDRARSWLAAEGPVTIVQVETPANLAVGDVAWGPRSAGAEVVDGAELVDAALASGSPGAGTADRGPAYRVSADHGSAHRVAVVGRGIGAAHPARLAATRLRDTGHDVLLVECDWPRGDADITTFGGSPLVSRALVRLLRGEVAP